jgi:transcriptional regulator with XRE-family HTH domain
MGARLAVACSGADGERPGTPPTNLSPRLEAAMQSPLPSDTDVPPDDRIGPRRHARELTDAVAANLTRLRRNSGLDIDQLAARSGVSREQLVALEGGRITPTLRCLWALAEFFAVPFGVLISGAPCATTSFHVLPSAGSLVVDSAGGGFRTRALSAAGDPREPEVYEVTLAAGWIELAEAHALDTFEHLVAVRGSLIVRAGSASAVLRPGDVVFFRADVPHVYGNPGIEDAVAHLTMSYAGDWVDDAPDD